MSTWAKEPIKPTYTASEVGLGNVDNTSDLDKPVSTAMNNALALKANTTDVNNALDSKANITDLYALGIDYDNGTSGMTAENVQEAVDELNKATTTLTTHTGNSDIHVTASEKTAVTIMPQSKVIDFAQSAQDHKDFVIPLICISNTQVNEYFSGRVFLKSTTATARQMSIINVYCCKNYGEEKPVFMSMGFFRSRYHDHALLLTTVKNGLGYAPIRLAILTLHV